MTDQLKVAFFASPEVEEVLADNGIDIVSVLREEGIEVERSTLAAGASEQTGLKDPVSIILASAAVIAVLTPIITKVLTTLSRKPIVVTETVLAPVETADGHVVCDTAGNPILQWIERAKLMESATRSDDSISLGVDTPIGLKFSFKAESNEHS